MDITSSHEATDMSLWVEEQVRDRSSMRFRVVETLYAERSEFQKVDVVRTTGHGAMLFIDGAAMLSERDEFVYHEMIAHVPLFVHPNPRRVLIIGGGDGGTAREVLRHSRVESCWNVEIDALVVEACRRYIPQTACSFDDPRMNLIIDDGVRFMAETQERFDLVIVDSTDPIGPAQPLFGEKFYSDVFRVLKEDGIVVVQGESPFLEPKAQVSILHNLGKSFPKLFLYNYTNTVYPDALWSFIFASKGLNPLADFNADRVTRSGLKFKWYNPALHRAAFCLPQFQAEMCDPYLTKF